MFCPKCGSQVADDDMFCRHCGASVAAAESAPESAPAPAPAAVDSGAKTEKAKSEENVLSILGFVFSFIISVVGLTLSIIAYNKIKSEGKKSNLAVAGIVVSSVIFALEIVEIVLTCIFMYSSYSAFFWLLAEIFSTL